MHISGKGRKWGTLGFPGGLVVKNPLFNARDTSLIPGLEKIPHASWQLSPQAATTEPMCHN